MKEKPRPTEQAAPPRAVAPGEDKGGAHAPVVLAPLVSALWRWSFPLALLLLVVLATIGRRGQYSDDFIFGLIDPATGEAAWPDSPLKLVDHFGRPLHLLLTPVLQTLLWETQWIYHLINAITHALVGLGLYALLRRLGAGWRASMAALAVFWFFPWHHEVVFWSTSLVIAIAAGLMVALLHACLAFARCERGFWFLAPIALLALGIPCFYEQPAAGAAAIPLLFLSVHGRGVLGRGVLVRAALATGAAGAGLLVYVVLKVKTAPPHARGGAGSIVSPAELPARVREVTSGVQHWAQVRGPRLVEGAVTQAGEAAGSWPLLAALLLVGLIGGVWAVYWMGGAADDGSARAGDPATHERRSSPRSIAGGWFLVLLGAVLFAVCWLPLAVVRDQPLPPRSWYAASLGLAALLGGLVQSSVAWGDRIGAGAPGRLLSLVVVMAVFFVGGLSMLGWADAMRLRWEADRGQPRVLVEALPRLSSPAVLAPLHDAYRPTDTGVHPFDLALSGWARAPWISMPVVRHAFGDRDLNASFMNPWQATPPLTEMDVDGWVYVGRLHGYPPNEQGRSTVPWSDTFPFTIDADGAVTLVDRIIIESANGDDFAVDLPHVGRAARADAARESFVMRQWGRIATIPEGYQPLERWRTVRRSVGPSAGAVQTRTWVAWEQRYEMLRLSAADREGVPAALAVRLPPAERARRAVFRATVAPHLLDDLAQTGPQELTFRLAGEPEPLARLRLEAQQLRRERRWLAAAFEIPPLEQPRRLIVEVEDLEPGGPQPVVFLSQGAIERVDAPRPAPREAPAAVPDTPQEAAIGAGGG